MTTHASSGKQWTDIQLDKLTVEENFRLRGAEVTRLDTFIDAAFAFVLTLLVISFDDIPSNYAEMVMAVKRIPGFAASFATLMMFWLQHRRWSRRYGLENLQTILLSLVLIFVMLVYVYPLRMVFEGLFSSITDGYFPTTFELNTYFELRMMFVFYSTGFVALSIIISALYRAAIVNAEGLALDDHELRRTRIYMQIWAIASLIGVVSVVMALTLPDPLVTLAGYLYLSFFIAGRIPAYLDRRKYRK